ncbi:BA75_00809T0 [Komagataella pastoris]|uniref:Probable transporter MCH1 n=1 Tax=Komagataella pastoris TaxID=4922 RepID=A0A1B2J9C5_PICPA|nr:BA75_00809T0 [Komagataella pastoris]
MTVSSIENALTHHIRQVVETHVDKNHFKVFSFVFSLITCLCAASVLIISIFTPWLIQYLNYNQFIINIIGAFIAIGMYLPLPYLGYLADVHGPVILAVLSLFMFFPGYMVASLVVRDNLHYIYLCISYGLIGCATSCLYFSSLLTCAKVFPNHKSLSITAPVACYGLSSLLLSGLLDSVNWFYYENGDLNLYRCFRFFAFFYFILGVINWVSSVIVTIERDLIFEEEQTPLIEPDDIHKRDFGVFLRDHSMYLFLFAFFLIVGPLETCITNIGSITTVIDPNGRKAIPLQVSLHAIFSTASRILVGGSLDYLPMIGVTPVHLMIVLVLSGTLAFTLITQGSHMDLISICLGFSYGGLFAITPNILVSIWGIGIFGSSWGLFMLAPAAGSTLFGLLYALNFDTMCKVASRFCLWKVFSALALCTVTSVIIIFFCNRVWAKRNAFKC